MSDYKRIFVFNKKTLADPNPNFTPNAVKDYYKDKYPEIVNAIIEKPVFDEAKGTVTYGIKASAKTKG